MDAFIVDYLRTPFGRFGGALASVRTDDLAAIPIRALIGRHGDIDPASIDPAKPTAAFVARMNARAEALGLSNTHYANPCGHDEPAQYTSVRDLAALSHVVLADATLAGIARQREVAFTTAARRRLSARTTNALLDGLSGARGLKTGTTPAAGRCLVTFVERGGRHVLAVLLHAPERWWDSVGLVELAFETPDDPPGR